MWSTLQLSEGGQIVTLENVHDVEVSKVCSKKNDVDDNYDGGE